MNTAVAVWPNGDWTNVCNLSEAFFRDGHDKEEGVKVLIEGTAEYAAFLACCIDNAVDVNVEEPQSQLYSGDRAPLDFNT